MDKVIVGVATGLGTLACGPGCGVAAGTFTAAALTSPDELGDGTLKQDANHQKENSSQLKPGK